MAQLAVSKVAIAYVMRELEKRFPPPPYQMWQARRMRDFFQRVMPFVEWKEFLVMRRVCKMWHDASLQNQNHWYEWLVFKGKPEGYKFAGEDHKFANCKATRLGKKCTDHRHYSGSTKIPKILKTVPLSKQVLQQVSKRAMRSMEVRLGKERDVMDKHADIAACARQCIARLSADIAVAQNVVDKHYSKRRRTHIELNISKPQ